MLNSLTDWEYFYLQLYHMVVVIIFKLWYNLEKHMSSKQDKIIKIIRNLYPKGLGIKEAYCKTSKNAIELIFVVDKNSAPALIGYINSLSTLIEKEVRGVKIESNIYTYDKTKNVENVIRKENFEKVGLINPNLMKSFAY